MNDAMYYRLNYNETSCSREAATICPAPATLTFDLLTFKVGARIRVTCDVGYVPLCRF